MRIIDFIGRNYVRIVLPEVDTSTIRDNAVVANPSLYLTDKRHMYLGSWHRDLIPRIINKVSFYPRQNAHKLFEYSGYDIYIYNILFTNTPSSNCLYTFRFNKPECGLYSWGTIRFYCILSRINKWHYYFFLYCSLSR